MSDLIITIFGSTGDLTSRKLLPAIAKLYQDGHLPKKTKVLALGRRDYTTKSYLEASNEANKIDMETLLNITEYVKMEITMFEHYQVLANKIKSEAHEDTKELFYLAIAPELFTDVSKHIHDAHIVAKNNLNQVIVFEKPFGSNLATAKKINADLWTYFDESQIYRIDHYLGKEMIQSILTVRFANRIFEEIWHNNVIKSVKLYVKENIGILNRANYYDTQGALKDMVQSHLLQMLSLVAMEKPKSLHSEDVKNEKVAVLKNLRFDHKASFFGQYNGYLNESGIEKTSKTETFVFLKTFVNTPRFKGVPFYMITGKKLDKKESYIKIEFEPSNQLFDWNGNLKTNKLYIDVDPINGFALVLNSKKDGLIDVPTPIRLESNKKSEAFGNQVEAYEKLILDITQGHKTLFTRWDEIESSWAFVDQVKDKCKEVLIYDDYKDIETKIQTLTKEDF